MSSQLHYLSSAPLQVARHSLAWMQNVRIPHQLPLCKQQAASPYSSDRTVRTILQTIAILGMESRLSVVTSFLNALTGRIGCVTEMFSKKSVQDMILISSSVILSLPNQFPLQTPSQQFSSLSRSPLSKFYLIIFHVWTRSAASTTSIDVFLLVLFRIYSDTHSSSDRFLSIFSATQLEHRMRCGASYDA